MDTVTLCIWSNKKCISASKYMVDGLLRLFYQQFSEVSEMSGTGDSVPCNKTEITSSVPFCAAETFTNLLVKLFPRTDRHSNLKITHWSRKSLGI